MTAYILDGTALAKKTLREMKEKIQQRKREGIREPSLAVILLGNDPASTVYVNRKRQACQLVGIRSDVHHMDDSIQNKALFDLIQELNESPKIDGILVQFPVPHHIDKDRISLSIDANKDIDGFHPYNMGRLAVRQPVLRPCTPWGVMKLIATFQQNLVGLEAVVIGASNHVGRPMALELLLAGCTVTCCHKNTRDFKPHLKTADIVITAVGYPHLVQGEWIKEGAIVVDIGINRLSNQQICGDVDFDSAVKRAGAITPVPGGVGPMTVATLMENTLLAQRALLQE